MNLKRITADEAKRMIDSEGYKLLDVRSMPEYNAEHAQGAYNIPYLHRAPQGMIPNADFSRVVQGLFPDKNEKLITSCQMGGRSVRAAAELLNMGYTNVVDMRGGFGSERDDVGNIVSKGWKDAGLPVEGGETPGLNYKDIAAKTNDAAAQSGAEGCAPAPSAQPGARLSRFADAKRVVDCVKFGKQLPGIKRRPFPGPLGERIYKEVSADAWELWGEHQKMLINEYRLNPSDPKSLELLMEQCEQFFFGEGSRLPEGYVPQVQSK
jgi:Fe-S cluster biosynthesis and repair protein YggX/rhodanese-related sulfurtransferase